MDLLLKMTQAVALPASGDIEYAYEIVRTNFKEDRWVQMAEVLPTLRSNVHHAVVYVGPPDSHWLRHAISSRRVVRQFEGESAQSGCGCSGALGRAGLRRNDGGLFRRWGTVGVPAGVDKQHFFIGK